MTLNASVRNLIATDSERMKNAMTTSAAMATNETTDFDITLTRRALAAAMSRQVKPTATKTRNIVARKPCLVNGKKRSSSTTASPLSNG